MGNPDVKAITDVCTPRLHKPHKPILFTQSKMETHFSKTSCHVERKSFKENVKKKKKNPTDIGYHLDANKSCTSMEIIFLV